MPRSSRTVKTVKMAFVLDPGVAEALKKLVADNCLNQSMFVQDAIVRRIRNYRPPLEFIAEARKKAKRSAMVVGLDPALDRPDGWPLAKDADARPRALKDLYRTMSAASYQQQINDARAGLGREPLTEAEWNDIVKYMGCEPNSAGLPPATNDFREE